MTLTPGLILKTQFFNLFLLTYLLVSMPFTWHFLTSWNICFSLWWSKWRLCAAVTAKIQVINNMGEVVKFVSSSQLSIYGADQGCQVVYFQTKNPYLGKFLRALDWKMLNYFTGIWNILRTIRIFYDHLVHLFRFLYRVPRIIWQPWRWHWKNLKTWGQASEPGSYNKIPEKFPNWRSPT
jgi:hypothetical protein